jgi:hypothetical protein
MPFSNHSLPIQPTRKDADSLAKILIEYARIDHKDPQPFKDAQRTMVFEESLYAQLRHATQRLNEADHQALCDLEHWVDLLNSISLATQRLLEQGLDALWPMRVEDVKALAGVLRSAIEGLPNALKDYATHESPTAQTSAEEAFEPISINDIDAALKQYLAPSINVDEAFDADATDGQPAHEQQRNASLESQREQIARTGKANGSTISLQEANQPPQTPLIDESMAQALKQAIHS